MKEQGLGVREQGLGIHGLGLFCCLLFLVVLGSAAKAQGIQLGDAPVAHKGHVELLSDAVAVMAGEPQVVELRFRVDDGFHINSHTPKDELLIPTVLQLDGAKVVGEQYPKGSTFRVPLGSGETLDVYQGEFRVSVRVVVPKGSSTLTGALRNQACDNTACIHPRILPVTVAVTAQ